MTPLPAQVNSPTDRVSEVDAQRRLVPRGRETPFAVGGATCTTLALCGQIVLSDRASILSVVTYPKPPRQCWS